MSSRPIEATDIESAFRQLKERHRNRTVLVVGYYHDAKKRELTFIMNIPLPRESEALYFTYGGNLVGPHAGVKNPRVSLCETPRVRSFLNELNSELQIEVLMLSLFKVVIRYREGPVMADKVVDIFVSACRSAHGIVEKDRLAHAPLTVSQQ